MFFERRTYTVREFTDAGELAERLDDTTWTLCTGFRIGDVLFVNDSTGPDGAQVYAALDEHGQFESIAFSWMHNVQEMLDAIVDCLTGPRKYLIEGVSARTDHQARFGRVCSLCE
jgi:hypothetical protein